MKKIIVITTGGTIAMKYDEEVKGLVPAVSGDDLIKAVPALKGLAQIEVKEFANVPSGYMTPQMMFDLAKKIDAYAKDEAVTGFVVTHGTDTLEETAYMIDMAASTQKPICVTGAMRGASETSPDGPGNILAAVQTAVAEDAYGQGVLVVLNDEIHTAAEVTKTHSTSVKTFDSPFWGPIGRVYFDRVVIKRHPLNLKKIKSDRIVDDVHLLKAVAGMDAYLLDCLIQKKVKGIVVEAFGCGNVSPLIKRGIEEARAQGIPVVLATRVHGGSVVPAYSYEGSANSMKGAGLILANELSGPKARLKLMVLLGMTNDINEMQKFF